MKTREEIKEMFKKLDEDNEEIHGLYDQLLQERMKELDPNFLNFLDDLTEDASFWYA